MAETEIRMSELEDGNISTRHITDVLQSWNKWRGNRAFPAWRDVNLNDLPDPLLLWTIVADCRQTPEGYDYIYRYWGAELTGIMGKEMTRKSYRELPEESFRDWTKEVYRQVRERREPILYGGHFKTIEGISYEDFAVRMPVGDSDDKVDKIISIIIIKKWYRG